MPDILKLGGDYFKYNQTFFQKANVQDPKTYLIGVPLILSWLSGGIPLICGALYLLDSLKTRLTRQPAAQAAPTAQKADAAAQMTGVQPPKPPSLITLEQLDHNHKAIIIQTNYSNLFAYCDPNKATLGSLKQFINDNQSLFPLASGAKPLDLKVLKGSQRATMKWLPPGVSDETLTLAEIFGEYPKDTTYQISVK